MSIEIRRLAVPERLGTPEAGEFEAYVDARLRARVERTGATTTSR